MFRLLMFIPILKIMETLRCMNFGKGKFSWILFSNLNLHKIIEKSFFQLGIKYRKLIFLGELFLPKTFQGKAQIDV